MADQTTLVFDDEKFDKNDPSVLGTLEGPCADFVAETRNGRFYNETLWENVFKDPIVNELIENGGIPGELDHPLDREEVDSSRIAILMKDKPVKKNGKLWAKFQILNTPLGKIAYTLAKAGFNLGISSRGQGEVFTNSRGQQTVDPDTYTFKCFDLVLIPAVKSARLKLISEGLESKKNKFDYKKALNESLNSATKEDRELMETALTNLGIDYKQALDQLEKVDDTPKDEFVQICCPHCGHQEFVKSSMFDNHCPMCNESLDGSDDTSSVPVDTSIDEDAEVTPIEDLQYKEAFSAMRDLDDDVIVDKNSAEELQDKDELEDEKKQILIEEPMIEDPIPEEVESMSEEDLFKECNLTEGNDSMSDDEILDEIAGTLEVEDKEAFKDEVKSGNAEKYADEVEAKCCDNCKARFKKFLDIKDESLNINTEASKSIAVDNDQALMSELQEALLAKAKLEKQVMELQERLSVGNSMEATESSEVERYKSSIQKLTESARSADALKAKVSKLEESLKQKETELSKVLSESKAKDVQIKRLEENQKLSMNVKQSLKEKVESKSNELDSVNESLNKLNEKFNKEREALNESIANLNKDIALKQNEYTSKMKRAKELIEKYKNTANTAVDKYVESVAKNIGVSVTEIKSRLNENYTFEDIDNAVEDIQDYKLSMNSLPFRFNEGIRMKTTSSKETILPASGFDDDVDDQLMGLAGL